MVKRDEAELPDLAHDPHGAASGTSAAARVRAVGVELDHRQLLALAAYGEPPRGWFAALPYALLVLSRHRSLKKDMAALGRRKDAVQKRLPGVLGAFGARLAAEPRVLPEDRRIELALIRVEQAGGQVERQLAERDALDATADDERQELAAALEAAKARARPRREEEGRLRATLEEAKQELRRRQQSLDHAQKELDAEPNPVVRAELIQGVSLRRQERDGVAEKVAGHEAAHDASRAKLDQALASVHELEEQLGGLEADVRASMKRLDRVTEDIAKDLEAAHGAFATLGLELLRDPAEATGWAEAKTAQNAIKAEAQLTKEILLHQKALEMHDAEGLKRGLRILAGVGAFLALTALVAAVS